jgi:hypothetical protein
VIASLRAWLDKAYAPSQRKLLWINLVIACLIAVAHGGALWLAISANSPDAQEIRPLATVSVPIAAFVILSAVAGLIRPESRPHVLAMHGLVLLVGVLVLLGWAATLLIGGLPKGNFSWSPGLLSASVFYAFLVFCRFTLSARVKALPGVYWVPLVALFLAVPVDVGIIIRFFVELGDRMGS